MTGVHPETYPVVEKLIATAGQPVQDLMGRAEMLKKLRPELFANEKFGVITVKDILAELEKPGRDPRPDFKVARFNDGVEDIADLEIRTRVLFWLFVFGKDVLLCDDAVYLVS